ncbi:hypothetical protein POM88_046439 [Heracleum sosnowskyi]|uniref:EIF3F/CSN6-like C-terminal domain-containing protein n=1 Tax=Heracleum sosnowskyi TaxID=360622 RepID=A0AAD8M4P6_9APIA|nr:hypothetical protein POM88_046439 [Heracleum sosnowskyi]
MEKNSLSKKIFTIIVFAAFCMELSNLPSTEATMCQRDDQCQYLAPICRLTMQIAVCNRVLFLCVFVLIGYFPNHVLVIIDVQPKELGIPTKAYYVVEEVKEINKSINWTLNNLPVAGVEHLLRDVKDTIISTLATEVTGKLAALKGLDARLREIRGYLDLVVDGKLPLNHEILYHLQLPQFLLLVEVNHSQAKSTPSRRP